MNVHPVGTIILAAVLLVILIALAGVYLLISSRDSKEVRVPNVVGKTIEEAKKLPEIIKKRMDQGGFNNEK